MKLAVNTDYSGFVLNQTQAEIDAYISAIVTAIPSVEYIAIGTYFDYPVIIARWFNSIHKAGKKVWFRGWGYNFWQGKNGVDVDNTLTALSNHRSQIQTFIANNASVFQSGDIFSAVPDEPENWGGWNLNYTSLGTAEGKTAFNDFIQGCIGDCDAAFSLAGVTGIEIGYCGTNTSVSKNTINSTTASVLTSMLIDAYWDGHSVPALNYPWGPLVDPHLVNASAKLNIGRWVNGSQGGKAYHITTGSNIYKDLTEAQQKETMNALLFSIIKNVESLHGITIWPVGRTTNPGSAIISYSNGVWTAKSVTQVIEAYFKILKTGDKPKRKLIV